MMEQVKQIVDAMGHASGKVRNLFHMDHLIKDSMRDNSSDGSKKQEKANFL